jgi:conjugal transfer pilin signal peptidase TrbI
MTETKSNNELTADDIRSGVTLPLAKTSSFPGKWAIRGLAVLITLGTMVAVSVMTVRHYTPEVVTFDMKGTMDTFLQQSAQLSLDEPQAKKLVARFNNELSRSLEDWQTRHNAIILVAPAVVSAQRDITAEIQNTVAVAMKQGSTTQSGERQ